MCKLHRVQNRDAFELAEARKEIVLSVSGRIISSGMRCVNLHRPEVGNRVGENLQNVIIYGADRHKKFDDALEDKY